MVHSKSALVGALLRAVARDDAPGAEAADLLAVEDPHALTVDLFDVRHAIAVLGRSATGEQVSGLGPVGVSVDDQLIV